MTLTDAELQKTIDIKTSFVNCVNCGKYIISEFKDKSLYCCTSCMDKYKYCNICDSYFFDQINHFTESLKCRLHLDLNKKGKPYIRETFFNTLVTGEPHINNERISEKLSYVLKTPVVISEQIRYENALSIESVLKYKQDATNAEKKSKYIIFLLNSYDSDFLDQLLNAVNFEKIVIIRGNKSFSNESLSTNEKLQLCTGCGNINSFSDSDIEGKTSCLICGSRFFSIDENKSILLQRNKSFQECLDFLSLRHPERCVNIDFKSCITAVNEIVQNIVYS